MAKIVMLVGLVLGLLWWMRGRLRGPQTPPPAAPPKSARPQAMLACAHCGVHLPQADVVADAAGRAYCSDAHRLAGPR